MGESYSAGDGPSTPLFRFGEGISYTGYTLDGLEIAEPNVSATGKWAVRQLRHHFGPSLRVVWALYHPTHAVYCALLGFLIQL